MEVFSLMTYNDILSFENNFYKELYEDGIKQRSQLNSKFTPTITILTAEIGGILWCLFRLINNIGEKVQISDIVTLVFIGITFLSIGIAIFHFIRCFTNFYFSYPKPNEVKKFFNENKKCLDEYTEEDILNNIIENLSRDYIKMAIDNCEQIEKHSKYLNKCYIFIVVTLAFIVIDFVLVLFL